MCSKRHEPWPVRYVSLTAPSRAVVSAYESTLAQAVDERPMQTFLAANPVMLRLLANGGHDFWCWDRPRFGSELVPDFLLCGRNSAGFHWTMIELESPQKPPLIKAGRPSAKLNEALSQIRDWRVWLRENVAYAQRQLGFRQLHAECAAIAIIGRRNQIEAKHSLRYRELSRDQVTVMTYDRLTDVGKAFRT